ncbi:MAG: hypothetical protein QM820_34010 [Minicystis sp.]
MKNGNAVDKPRAVVAKLSQVTLVSVTGGAASNTQPAVIHQIPVAQPL